MMRRRRLRFCDLSRNSMAAQRTRLKRMRLIKWMMIGRLIKAASDRKAPADETCKLIAAFGEAEIKMIKYVDLNAAVCGIPQRVSDQLKAGHKNTEALREKVCTVAQQMTQQKAAAAPSLSEALGSVQAPEAVATKKGGSTFDTLNGNVLSR